MFVSDQSVVFMGSMEWITRMKELLKEVVIVYFYHFELLVFALSSISATSILHTCQLPCGSISGGGCDSK